jgi:signal transduction histidine kinase
VWLAFLVFTSNPDLPKNELLGYIINHYTINGVKGLVIIGVIAMAMSTADSYINSSSVLISNDICVPIGVKEKYSLLISRIFSVLLGLVSITLALSVQDLLEMILIASSFYVPIVTGPILITIFGFRTTEKSILFGMGAGVLVILLRDNYLKEWWFASTFFSVLANISAMLVVHYFTKQEGGWVISYHPIQDMKESYKKWRRFFKKLDLMKSLDRVIPRHYVDYVFLGIYYFILTITTIYSTQNEMLLNHKSVTLPLYQIMLISSTTMIMYPAWPRSISPEIKRSVGRAFWVASVVYMLVIFNTFFVIASQFSRLQFAIFSINLIIFMMLMGWRWALAVVPIGFYLGKKLFHLTVGDYQISPELISPDFVLLYAAMLTVIALLLFFKPKQEYTRHIEDDRQVLYEDVSYLSYENTNLTKENTNLAQKTEVLTQRVQDHETEIERLGATSQRILNNVNHELRLPVGNVMNFAEMLRDGVGKLTPENLKLMSDEIYQNTNRLSTMILNMLDLAMLTAKKIELKRKTMNFGELIEERVKICRDVYLQGKKIDFHLVLDPEVLIPIDANYMRQVIDNIIINSINFSTDGVIKVDMRRFDNNVYINISDDGVGIPREELYDIFTAFKMGSNVMSKAKGRGVGLALCRAAIEAHGGTITADSNGLKGAKFQIILPIIQLPHQIMVHVKT